MLKCSYISGIYPTGDQVKLAVWLTFFRKIGYEGLHRNVIPGYMAAYKAGRMNGNKMDFTISVLFLQKSSIELINNTVNVISNNLG
ncbi:hypothetical protein D3C75_1154630 [compost metagenome]